MNIIEAEQLTYTYPRTSQPVLQDLSFQIPAGCVTALLGSRGSGKSTLCLALAGIVPGFYGGEWLGRLHIGDVEVSAEEAQSSDVVRQVAIALQTPDTQIIGFRVEETIAFGLENQGIPSNQIRQRIQSALDELGISHLQHQFTDQLSGGQKQACVLAAMLALDTPIIVLDESTAALDPAGKRLVAQVVERLKQVGKTLIISDHDLNWFQHLVDQALVLSPTGRLLFSGQLDAFLNNRRLVQQSGIPVPTLVTLSQALQDSGYDVPIWTHLSDAQTWIANHLAIPAKQARPRTLDAIAPVLERATVPTVDCTQLTFVYPGSTTPALSDVSFAAYPGRVLGIMGQNGSGKSTAIRHLNGLLRPRRGTVRIGGNSIRKKSVAQMASQVGIVFQNPDLMLFNETVEQEVLFSVMLANDEAWKQRRKAEIEALMQQLSLAEHRQRSPLALSVGEKQMLAILSALALDPEVFVLDEPTSGLDQAGRQQLGHIIQQLKQQKTILCISHDLPLLIEQADEILAFQNGQVVCCKPTGQILQDLTLFDQLGIPLPDYVQLANEFLGYPCFTPHELAQDLHRLIGAGSHV